MSMISDQEKKFARESYDNLMQISQLSARLEKIKALVANFPNDQDLGKELRKIVDEDKKKDV